MTQQMIIGGSGDNLNNSATEFNFIQCRHDGLWDSDESKKYAPIPTNGNFTKLHVKLSAAPNGATKSYKFTIMKNGVAQTSTDLTFTNTETDKSTTFTLDLVPEDLVSIRCIPTNTPDIVDAKWCIVWEPDTTDEFIYLESAQEDPYDNVGEHRFISQGGAGTWNATEDNKTTLMPTAGTWKKLAFKLRGGNLGVGETRTLTVRKGAFQTPYGWASTTLKVTISQGADSGIDNSNSFTVVKDDAVNMEATQTGTPLTGARVSWGMVFVPTVAKEYPMFSLANYTYTTQDLRYGSIGQATTQAQTTTEADAIENFVTNEVDVTKLRVWFTVTHGASSIFVAVRDDGVDTNLDIDCINADNWEDIDTHTLAAGSEFAMKLDTDALPADRTINCSCVFIDKSTGVTTQTKTFTMDTVLQDTFTDTFTIDTILQKVFTDTFTIDTILQKVFTDTFTIDTILQKVFTDTFTMDAVLTGGAVTQTFTIDTILQKVFTDTFTIDTYLVKRFTDTFTIDAHLIKVFTDTFTMDAVLSGGAVTDTFTIDTILQKVFTDTFTIDAILKDIFTDTFTIDAYLVKVFTDTFTIDAHLTSPTITKQFTIDAVLTGGISITVSKALGDFVALKSLGLGEFEALKSLDLGNFKI